MKNARKLLPATFLVCSLAATGVYAGSAPQGDATPQTDAPALVVRFSDLNLDRPRDIARLFNRVSAAAENVCGPRSLGGYFPTAGYAACYREAVARAVTRIDRDSVSDYFRQRRADSVSRPLTFAQQ